MSALSTLRALDSRTGLLVWSFVPSLTYVNYFGTPALVGGNLYITSTSPCALYCINASTEAAL